MISVKQLEEKKKGSDHNDISAPRRATSEFPNQLCGQEPDYAIFQAYGDRD